MNGNGELFLKRHPNLKIRVVDGGSLVVALVINSIPNGITEVILRGKFSKIVCAITQALLQRGVQVQYLYVCRYYSQ